MKKIYFYSVLMMIFSINLNCNKELIIAPPKVVTASPDEIFTTSVKIGGKVIYNRQNQKCSECKTKNAKKSNY